MRSGCMTGAIGVDRGGCLRQHLFKTGEGGDLLDRGLMFNQMVDLLQHVEERLLCRRGRHNGGDGDPLMPIDVTVDAGEIDQDGRQAEDEQCDNEAERQEKLFPDRQMAKPAGGSAAHGVPYHSEKLRASVGWSTSTVLENGRGALHKGSVEWQQDISAATRRVHATQGCGAVIFWRGSRPG